MHVLLRITLGAKLEVNGNSDDNPVHMNVTPSDATSGDATEKKRGRKTLVENNKRKTLVQELMLKGLKPLEIANLGVANYKTILNDIRDIQTSWLDLDPEWLNRARLARITSEKMYETQLKRLFTYLENEDLSYKEKLYVEGLIQNVITKLEEKSSKLDPEQYLQQRIKERLTFERKRLEEAR
tara:strand:+ start:140 stop:688 length:549 start_codon:yes stop_codon:yes gene_type:complete